MLIEVDAGGYAKRFPSDPHSFVSDSFIRLNERKVERVVRLVEDVKSADMGLVAGLNRGILQSPFSAPFGGFHFRHQVVYSSRVDGFVGSLHSYIVSAGLEGIEITLPPDIYHQTFNAKLVSSLLRNGFRPSLPEITNWVDLERFAGRFSEKNSRECHRQSVRHGLRFTLIDSEEEQKQVYELVAQNRIRLGRPIHMTFEDVLRTSCLWPTDFFKVATSNNMMVASAILYRNHPSICYCVFYGDSEAGRSLKAMDYLLFELWSYYKRLGFKYVDLGISTERGNPNEGLLRFKESHNATSSLRYKFVWCPEA